MNSALQSIQRQLAQTAADQRAAAAALDSRIAELPELRAWRRAIAQRRMLEKELKAVLRSALQVTPLKSR